MTKLTHFYLFLQLKEIKFIRLVFVNLFFTYKVYVCKNLISEKEKSTDKNITCRREIQTVHQSRRENSKALDSACLKIIDRSKTSIRLFELITRTVSLSKLKSF